MTRSSLLLLAAVLVCLATGPALATHCTFENVAITPVGAENGQTYHGLAAGVEVVFHNDVLDRPVTLFPEPPLTIRRAQPASECVLADGGVWGREAVWLSADGRTLATTESSGSSANLVLRDTASCAKVGEIDVAGARVSAEAGGQLVLHPVDGRRHPRRLAFDAACRPLEEVPPPHSRP